MNRGMKIQMAVCFHWDGQKQLGWATAFDGPQSNAVTGLKLKTTDFRGSENGQKFLARNRWEEIRGKRVLFIADASGNVLARGAGAGGVVRGRQALGGGRAPEQSGFG